MHLPFIRPCAISRPHCGGQFPPLLKPLLQGIAEPNGNGNGKDSAMIAILFDKIISIICTITFVPRFTEESPRSLCQNSARWRHFGAGFFGCRGLARLTANCYPHCMRYSAFSLWAALFLSLCAGGAQNAFSADAPTAPRTTQQDAAFELVSEAGRAYRARDYQLTIEKCTAAIATSPETSRAWSLRGDAYSAMNQTERALADYNQAIKADPKSVMALNGRGSIYVGQGKANEAIADFNAAIALDPLFESLYVNRGNALADAGRNELALADFDKAIELDPRNAVPYYNRANVHNAMGKRKEAIADYTMALKINHNLVQAYNDRGNAYADAGENDKAIADYSAAITADPKYAQPYNGRGGLYTDLGKQEEALADLNKAIELDPKDASFYFNRGKVYFALNKLDLALADFNKAIMLDPKLAAAYRGRGFVYRKMGDEANAKKDLEIEADLRARAKALGVEGVR